MTTLAGLTVRFNPAGPFAGSLYVGGYINTVQIHLNVPGSSFTTHTSFDVVHDDGRVATAKQIDATTLTATSMTVYFKFPAASWLYPADTEVGPDGCEVETFFRGLTVSTTTPAFASDRLFPAEKLP